MWSQEAAEIRLGWLGEKHPLSVASQKDLNALREMTGVVWSLVLQEVWLDFSPHLKGCFAVSRPSRPTPAAPALEHAAAMVVELTPTKMYPGGSNPFVKYTPEGGSFALCATGPA